MTLLPSINIPLVVSRDENKISQYAERRSTSQLFEALSIRSKVQSAKEKENPTTRFFRAFHAVTKNFVTKTI
nr:MAG TPA: hypothetical protein [Caudoviricetes sp.]